MLYQICCFIMTNLDWKSNFNTVILHLYILSNEFSYMIIKFLMKSKQRRSNFHKLLFHDQNITAINDPEWFINAMTLSDLICSESMTFTFDLSRRLVGGGELRLDRWLLFWWGNRLLAGFGTGSTLLKGGNLIG